MAILLNLIKWHDVNGLPLPPDADMCKDAQLEKEEELKKALTL